MAGASYAGEVETTGGDLPPCTLDRCGVECVDLNTDPNNCGGCGWTCVLESAEATCVDGACAIDSCLPNSFDEDGLVGTGCESYSACSTGAPCLTTCGSEGEVRCEGDEELCAPPMERCDLVDNDCDGSCDETESGPQGCRVGIHRGYGNGLHLFTSDLGRFASRGFSVESENYFYLYQDEIPNGRPVFFCETGDQKPFLSTMTDCGIGRAPLSTLGFWIPSPECGAQPLYHLTQAPSGNNFYTVNAGERDNAVNQLGYEDQGVIGYIWR